MSESFGTPVFASVATTAANGYLGDASSLTATSKTNGTATLSTVLDTAISGLAVANQTRDALATSLRNLVQTSQIGKPGGVIGIDGTGTAIIPGGIGVAGNVVNMGTTARSSVALKIGAPGASNQWQRVQFYSGSSSSATTWSDVTFTAMGGTGVDDGTLLIGAQTILPGGDNRVSLGSASARYAGIYLASSPNVTSDATDKTVIGQIGDPTYAEGQAIAKLWDMLSPKVYILREDGRHHVGLIAQDVQQALAKAGLDPASIGMWGQDFITQVVDETNDQGVVTGQKIVPVLNPDGSAATRQSLRYDELCVAIFAGAKIALDALTSRVAALEAKADRAEN